MYKRKIKGVEIMPKKQHYGKYLGFRDTIDQQFRKWLGEDYSDRVRTILNWCYDSYPDINDLLELIKK